MIRVLLGLLALWDIVLAFGSIVLPEIVMGLIWPTAGENARVMLQRTGFIWLFFALAQGAAGWRPVPIRLRLVAVLRWMDIPADLVWFFLADGLTTLGTITIGGFPLVNLILGWTFWSAANRATSCSTR